MSFTQKVQAYIESGFPFLHVRTSEEFRARESLTALCEELGMVPVFWNVIEGFYSPKSLPAAASQRQFKDPAAALRATYQGDVFTPDVGWVFVFCDFDDFMGGPGVQRMLRNIYEDRLYAEFTRMRHLVLLTPVSELPQKVQYAFPTLEMELPDDEQLTEIVMGPALGFAESVLQGDKRGEFLEKLERHKYEFVAQFRGLTEYEAENAAALALYTARDINHEAFRLVQEHKAAAIAKNRVLTYIPEEKQASAEEIGGFKNFLRWLQRRTAAYSREAREAYMDYPRGAILIGVPGTGKSYVAKAAAKLLGLPGYIMDISSVFGSLVGESEQRMRDALRQIDAQRGAVVVVDEADKAFGGAVEGASDSGTSRRVFGLFLTWLAEQKDWPTFVIMTLNRTKGLPPELLRAGRFDAIFYTDLPGPEERREILEVHMRKRQLDPAGYSDQEWKQLLDMTEGLVGAELEQLLIEARFISWAARQSPRPTLEEIQEAMGAIRPIAKTEAEAVQEIRAWCSTRAVPVSLAADSKGPSRKRRFGSASNN